MKFESLRPYVADKDDLFDLLRRHQEIASASLGWRFMGALGALIVGLAVPGAMGKAALCLALVAGFAWAWAMVDITCRYWFMQVVDLQDLVRPVRDPALTVLDVLTEIEEVRWAQAEMAAQQAASKVETSGDGGAGGHG